MCELAGVRNPSSQHPLSGFVGRRGGAWVSFSCQRGGNKEIEEFPGTAWGELSCAPRQAVRRAHVQSPWPAARWNFQWEPGKTNPGKAPPQCTCPVLFWLLFPEKVETSRENNRRVTEQGVMVSVGPPTDGP